MYNITKLQVLWNLEKETPSLGGIELVISGLILVIPVLEIHSRILLGDSNLSPKNYS